jgi:hypothetical protein
VQNSDLASKKQSYLLFRALGIYLNRAESKAKEKLFAFFPEVQPTFDYVKGSAKFRFSEQKAKLFAFSGTELFLFSSSSAN